MSYNWEFTHFYVIPGNEKEFQEYAHNHTSRLSKIGMVPRIVLLEYDLSSDVNPSGIFIGTWKHNPHMAKILATLHLLCTDPGKNFMIKRAMYHFTGTTP